MTLLRLFLASGGRLLLLALGALRPVRASPAAWLRRAVAVSALTPLFALVQLIHWIGFLLDEVFYPGYRKVPIDRPLFVLGVPRSGTTHLHRVLARDPAFTTFKTWECLFALSVTERRLWMALDRLDRRLGRPAGRLVERVESLAFGGMEAVHNMGLEAPEEDYFALMPVLACFILILAFPTDPYLWRMAGFDREMPTDERRRLLAFYRGCLQRHLYACGGADGSGLRLLSKNAAFAPLAEGLRETFPDARFLVLLREPERTVPSQLSSVASGVAFFAADQVEPRFDARLAQRLAFYYENLGRALGDMPPDRCVWLTMDELCRDLVGSVSDAYAALGLSMSAAFSDSLAMAAAESRSYRSGHSYSLEALSPTLQETIRNLGLIYRRLATRSIRAGGDRSRPPTQLEAGPKRGEGRAGIRAPTEAPEPC